MSKVNFVIVLISMLFVSVSSNAQVKSVGLRVGVNLASVSSSDDAFESDNITGLDIAIPVEIGVSDAFSIQPELHFVQKGWEATILGVETLSKVNYLEVPILARVNVGLDALKLYGVAGPSLGYAMGGSISVTALGNTITEDYTFSDEEVRIDVGAVIGVGAEVEVGPGAAVLDARYNYDVNDDGSDFNFKNRGIGLTLGYVIKLQ